MSWVVYPRRGKKDRLPCGALGEVLAISRARLGRSWGGLGRSQGGLGWSLVELRDVLGSLSPRGGKDRLPCGALGESWPSLGLVLGDLGTVLAGSWRGPGRSLVELCDGLGSLSPEGGKDRLPCGALEEV